MIDSNDVRVVAGSSVDGLPAELHNAVEKEFAFGGRQQGDNGYADLQRDYRLLPLQAAATTTPTFNTTIGISCPVV
jgi:hypothetical protein